MQTTVCIYPRITHSVRREWLDFLSAFQTFSISGVSFHTFPPLMVHAQSIPYHPFNHIFHSRCRFGALSCFPPTPVTCLYSNHFREVLEKRPLWQESDSQ